MNRLRIAFLAFCVLMAQVAQAQVSRPNPSATPQPDPNKGVGVPHAVGTPACSDQSLFFFGDSTGRCIYACTDGKTTIVAGVACSLPTVAATLPIATATPTPTQTPTPTATPTLTPTPTPTATA